MAIIATNPEIQNTLLGEYVLARDVILVPCDDGSARLLDMKDQFYGLTPPAAAMLRGVLSGTTDDAIASVSLGFGADTCRVRRDLSKLVANLRAKQLIFRADEIQPKQKMPLAGLFLRSLIKSVRTVMPGVRAKAYWLLLLIRLGIAFCGWTNTVELLRSCLPNGMKRQTGGTANLGQANVGRDPAATDSDNEYNQRIVTAVDSAVRAALAKHFVGMACKERGLCSWFLLRSANVPAQVVIGVTLYPLAGHCWCESGSRIVADTPAKCDEFMPVGRY